MKKIITNSKNFRFFVLLVIFLITNQFLFCQKNRSKNIKKDTVIHVSMINLIATPEKYYGHIVRFTGYIPLHMYDDNCAIYLSKEDDDNIMPINSIFLINNMNDLFDLMSKFPSRTGYYTIEGEFDMDKIQSSKGILKNFTKLTPVP